MLYVQKQNQKAMSSLHIYILYCSHVTLRTLQIPLNLQSQAMRPDLALHRRQSGDKQLSSAGVVSPAHLHSLALVCIELCQSAELSPTQAMLSSTELADILCRKMCVCIMSCEVSSESEKT